jgi:N-acyl-D-aspartate/D-glutamate deacylase/CubicO group peptidase (beta-lactamase class C family)
MSAVSRGRGAGPVQRGRPILSGARLAGLLAAFAGAVAIQAQAVDRIDGIVAAELARQQIPGAAVAVIRSGDVVRAQGYGLANVEHRIPVTPDTIFQSGSVGKQFTAAAVMTLVEDGLVSLTDPVTKYFPDAPGTWAPITVRHLLTHTSGIADYTGGRIDYRRDYSEDELARLAYDQPLDFPPGSQWKYSNTGYVLLGAVVRKASGRFYGDLLRERVFAPLGMKTARVISEAEIVPNRADGYRLQDGALRNQEWVSPSLNTTADGSLYLTLRDLIAWDRGLRSGAVLRPESWKQIFEPVELSTGRRHPYGFGWDVERLAGQPVQQHGGAWQGFKTHIARYLGDDLTVIVLTNLAQANPQRLAHDIAAEFIPKLNAQPSWTIVGADVLNGTGGAARRATVRIEGGTIRAVGDPAPAADDRVIDATGLVLAPGFIDAHNHSTDGLANDPEAVTQVSQGITTVLVGQDGSSPWPLADYLNRRRENPAAVNVAVLVGHATVRRQVMGDDFRRAARADEIQKMTALVDEAMEQGAIGLSSGLEYEVGSYASTEEVVSLARAAGRRGGFYISHIRDEADRTLEAVREAIAIGERARIPVQITHIKLGTVGVWGKAADVVALIEAARARGRDVTADAYPYLAWQSNLKVLVPNKRWDDPASVQEALDDVGGGRNIQITRLPTFAHLVGKRLDEAARAEGTSEVDLYIRIVKDEDAGVIGHTMSEADMRVFYQQPWTMVASDGGIGMPHPRGAGTFPRVLGRFVREEGWLTLPEAVRKMTSLPAARLGLADRGLIREGMKADLVLFDPAMVLDRSTFEEPARRANGIHTVWVNGQVVWRGDRPEGNRTGVVITRPR